MNCIGLFIQSWFVVLSTTKTLEIQNVNIYSYCYIFIKINSYLFTDIGWTYHINPLNITKYMFNEELTGYASDYWKLKTCVDFSTFMYTMKQKYFKTKLKFILPEGYEYRIHW